MEWKDRVKSNPYLKKLIIDGEEKIVEIREIDENIIENGTPLNAENIQTLDDSKVSKNGDTMTGSLVLADSSYLDGIDNEGNRSHLIRIFNNKVNIGQGDKVIYFDTNADIEYWKNGEGYTIASTKYVDNKFKQKILWQDVAGSFMKENQVVTLSQKISEQNNGIVLVFEKYDIANSEPVGYGFTTFFVPKSIISAFWDGIGMNFQICNNSTFHSYKYLTIYDNKITGVYNNSQVVNGVDNRNDVLVAVIGV